MPDRRLPPICDYERSLLRNVEKFGWHCTSVYPREGDEDSPRFSYTVGLFETYGASELIIFGLSGDTAHSILSIYANRLSKGEPIPLDLPSDDLINHYRCVFVPVPRSRYNDFVYSALWFYAEVEFPLHQVVWPDSQGNFPWHSAATQDFRETQPVLLERQ